MEDSTYTDMLRVTMEQLASTATHPSAIDVTLREATRACVDMIRCCRSADILIIDGGTVY